MTSRMWHAGVVVAVMGLVGCASGGGTVPTLPDADSLERARVARRPDWSLKSIGGKPVVAGTTLTAPFSARSR